MSIENIVCVIAADMHKIARVWNIRYGNDFNLEGYEYLEKFFQLRLALPNKNPKEMEEYVENLALPFHFNQKNLLVSIVQLNPRKLKLTLNSLYFVLYDNDLEIDNDDYLNTLMTWIVISLFHPVIAQKVQFSPSSLYESGRICLRIGKWSTQNE